MNKSSFWLMRHQLFSVPFENLDVQAGKIVSLAPDDIVEKVLKKGCRLLSSEVNGFCHGAGSTRHSLPFRGGAPDVLPCAAAETHMALIAEVESRQVALRSLGSGSYGIRAPMALDTLDVDITQDFRHRFAWSCSAEGEYLLEAKVEGEWARQYGFDLTPQEWIDFVPQTTWNSTHPDAIFVQKRVVVQHSPEGRQILLGDMPNHHGEWHRNAAVGGGGHPPCP